jgi:predicted membrane protein
MRSSSRKKRRTKNKVLFLILFSYHSIFLISFLIILFLKIPRLRTQEFFFFFTRSFLSIQRTVIFDSTLQTILFQMFYGLKGSFLCGSYKRKKKKKDYVLLWEGQQLGEEKKGKGDRKKNSGGGADLFLANGRMDRWIATSSFYADMSSGVPSSSSSSENSSRPKACLIC